MRTMTLHHHRTPAQLARFGALAQAILFAASLVAAPLLHEWTCTGACAKVSRAAALGAACHGAPPCHAGGGPRSKPHGCQCTDDCCSLWAQFVSPPAVVDDAPARLASRRALPSIPDPSERAPAARLLPFGTGPPPIA